MIIDIHAHTTNHKLWNLHTQTATIEDLEKLAEKHGVVKILLMATYFPFKGSGLHNEELLARVGDRKLGPCAVRNSRYGNDGPLFAVCGSLNMMDNVELGVIRLRRLAQEKKIVGIKLYPGYQDFKPSSVIAFPVYELAEEFGLPVIFHTGYLHHCCHEGSEHRCGIADCPLDKLEYLSRPSQFFVAAQRFPRVNFVAAHLGNPHFEEMFQLMSACPNVYTDISGVQEDKPEDMAAVIAAAKRIVGLQGGAERLMFGTDFPIQSYEETLAIVDALGLSEAERELILWKNATKLFHLWIITVKRIRI